MRSGAPGCVPHPSTPGQSVSPSKLIGMEGWKGKSCPESSIWTRTRRTERRRLWIGQDTKRVGQSPCPERAAGLYQRTSNEAAASHALADRTPYPPWQWVLASLHGRDASACRELPLPMTKMGIFQKLLQQLGPGTTFMKKSLVDQD